MTLHLAQTVDFDSILLVCTRVSNDPKDDQRNRSCGGTYYSTQEEIRLVKILEHEVFCVCDIGPEYRGSPRYSHKSVTKVTKAIGYESHIVVTRRAAPGPTETKGTYEYDRRPPDPQTSIPTHNKSRTPSPSKNPDGSVVSLFWFRILR